MRLLLTTACALVCFAGALSAQSPKSNPFVRDPAAVRAGRELFLERCAVCHGQDAGGAMAANLVRSRTVVSGPDAQLFDIIYSGIPGTEMPPQADLEPNQVWRIVAYLHNLARPGLQPPVPGNSAAGRDIFRSAGCAQCHRVEGEGGFLGPALDSIGARKTSAEIRQGVLEPSAAIAEGYVSAVAVLHSGERVEGLLKNEDTFSVQLLTRGGAFRLLARKDIRELLTGAESPMPAGAAARLSPDQLQNLLAFLDRRREPFVTVERGFGNY